VHVVHYNGSCAAVATAFAARRAACSCNKLNVAAAASDVARDAQLARMCRVLDSLLDMSLISHGEIAITVAEVDVPALLRDVAQVRRYGYLCQT
jgi:hypothetical protein